MKISGVALIVALMILVVMSICPIWAEDVFSNGPISGQSGPYSAGSADSPQLIRGPSSSDVYSRPAANSSVYPPMLYPPTAYPPNSYPPASNPLLSSPPALTGQQYQTLTGPANPVCVPPDITMPALGNRLIESTWYTRVDYFNWNELIPGSDDVNEYGTLLTFGYMRRVGIERFHAAVFGATMIYKGSSESDNGDGTYTDEPLTSATGYLGVLAEYDLHIEPDWCPNLSFFVGVGTRFWIRDLKDGVTDYGDTSWGYQEYWWTFYPYLGLEKKRSLDGNWEFYYAARIGCTAMTYQYATWGGVPLYPKASLTGQLECGLRGRSLFVSVFTEVFSWGHSDAVEGYFQPDSRQFTIGLKTGFCF